MLCSVYALLQWLLCLQLTVGGGVVQAGEQASQAVVALGLANPVTFSCLAQRHADPNVRVSGMLFQSCCLVTAANCDKDLRDALLLDNGRMCTGGEQQSVFWPCCKGHHSSCVYATRTACSPLIPTPRYINCRSSRPSMSTSTQTSSSRKWSCGACSQTSSSSGTLVGHGHLALQMHSGHVRLPVRL